MTNTQKFLQEMYLEYFNDYLTVDKFAEHKGITPHAACQMLKEGKAIHEWFVDHWKACKAA
jgi:hypothetical protein